MSGVKFVNKKYASAISRTSGKCRHFFIGLLESFMNYLDYSCGTEMGKKWDKL